MRRVEGRIAAEKGRKGRIAAEEVEKERRKIQSRTRYTHPKDVRREKERLMTKWYENMHDGRSKFEEGDLTHTRLSRIWSIILKEK